MEASKQAWWLKSMNKNRLMNTLSKLKRVLKVVEVKELYCVDNRTKIDEHAFV